MRTGLKKGNIAHARPCVFPIKVFFHFLALLLHNAIQTSDFHIVKCEGASFTTPSPVLHSGWIFPKRIRLRVFFRTVTDSILHFMNYFPHCYGKTRNRTGIFFWTVAVTMSGFLSGFLDRNGMYGLIFWLSRPVIPRKWAKKNFNRYVKDTPSHVLFSK